VPEKPRGTVLARWMAMAMVSTAVSETLLTRATQLAKPLAMGLLSGLETSAPRWRQAVRSQP
jgi:hypothetical protein